MTSFESGGTSICPIRASLLQGRRLDAQDELDYLTNFERKFRKEGRAIYRAEYEKPEAASGA